MIYTELTKKAMRIAYDAHYGQKDRGGTPYICHPLHVADGMTDEETAAAAILHDVLEDTEVTVSDFEREGIPASVIETVKLLTRDETLTYKEYIDRIAGSGNRAAMQVKLADLRHNMDESRTESGSLPPRLINRYRAAFEVLTAAVMSGQEE